MIQSLLTQAEYDEMAKKYNTYNPSKRKGEKEVREEEGMVVGPPPNYIMGDNLNPKEVKVINSRLRAVMVKAGLIKI